MPVPPVLFPSQRRFIVGPFLLLRLPAIDFTVQMPILFVRVPRITSTRPSTSTCLTPSLRRRTPLINHPRKRFPTIRRPSSRWLRLRSVECTFLDPQPISPPRLA
jgi:hypothetical protein